jgi:stress-induced morphogen
MLATRGIDSHVMPSAQEIKDRIEAAIPGALAEVEDYTGGGDHFRATVTAPVFDGRSRIEQHRLVYDVFGQEVGAAIHALSLKTQAPDEGAASGHWSDGGESDTGNATTTQ